VHAAPTEQHAPVDPVTNAGGVRSGWARWRGGPSAGGAEALIGGVVGALLLAARSGLPPADVVRECAHTARRSRAEHTSRRLGRLPVLLVLPLGLCLLPASALLGIAPVVLGLLTQLRV